MEGGRSTAGERRLGARSKTEKGKEAHLDARILAAGEQPPRGLLLQPDSLSTRLVPLPDILVQLLVRNPGEGEDVADIVVWRMDEVEQGEGRSVPDADSAVAYGETRVSPATGKRTKGNEPDALMSQSRSSTNCRASTAPVCPVKRPTGASVS